MTRANNGDIQNSDSKELGLAEQAFSLELPEGVFVRSDSQPNSLVVSAESDSSLNQVSISTISSTSPASSSSSSINTPHENIARPTSSASAQESQKLCEEKKLAKTYP